MKRMSALVVIAIGAREAAAGPGATAWGQYEASYVRRRGAADGANEGLGLAGLRMRAVLGDDLGWLVGLDLHAGATRPGGFAYQVDLHLLGAGLRLGEHGSLTLGTGVGVSGATGTMDDAVECPAEASLNLSLGSRVRLMVRGRAVWLGGADGRQHGAPSFDQASVDELDGSIALRWGRSYHYNSFPSGNGYFAGVTYRESEGSTFLGAVIGYNFDVGTPRGRYSGW